MTVLVLDAGALIAIDRNDRGVSAMLRVVLDDGDDVLVPAGVIAQTWRGGARPANLARTLRRCDEVPLDSEAARAAGLLCGRVGTRDVIDASVAVTAAAAALSDSVTVLTSDPDDLASLLSAVNVDARLVPV
jgi:hypothetical protein